MYLLGAFYSLPVHLGHSARKYDGRRCFTLSRYISAIWGKNVPAGGFLFSAGSSVVFFFSAGTFWPFRANMDRLGVVYSQSNIVDGFDENVWAWGCLFSGGRDWPFEAKMYCQEFLCSGGTFCQFWVKMYRLGVFCCHPVDFGHLGRKCSGQGVFMLRRWFFAILGRKCTGRGLFIFSRYNLAILGENVPAGVFLF